MSKGTRRSAVAPSAGAPRSLQARVLVAVLGGVAVVWLVAAVAGWVDVRHELDELLDGHLAQDAAWLLVHAADDPGDARDGTTVVPAASREMRRVAYQVWRDGRLVARSDQAPVEALSTRSHGYEDRVVARARWRVFTLSDGRGTTVQVGDRLSARNEIAYAVLRSALWPLALALPVLAVLLWAGVRLALAPLLRLGDEVARRRGLIGQPQAREPLSADPATRELLPLVAALNELFDRVAGLLEAERRFTSDAAHELRTPIAAIRAQAEVARAAVAQAERQHALDGVLDGCDRAVRLVDQLLTLARLEGQADLLRHPVDLAVLTRSVAADLAPQALQRDQQLTLEDRGPFVIDGEPTLLRVLLRNLVDNALRYCPPGATVALQVGPQGWAIEDSGPGLQPAVAQRLGERFVRGEGHDAAGSGLGWSIVRRIARVHGLDVMADASPAWGGLRVRLEPAALPYAAHAAPAIGPAGR